MKKKILFFLLLLRSIFVWAQGGYEAYTCRLVQSTEQLEFWAHTTCAEPALNPREEERLCEDINLYVTKDKYEPFLLKIKPSQDCDVPVQLGHFSDKISGEIFEVSGAFEEGAAENQMLAFKRVPKGGMLHLKANQATFLKVRLHYDKDLQESEYWSYIQIQKIKIPVRLIVRYTWTLNNFPDPIHNNTIFDLRIVARSNIKLLIFDLNGRVVAELLNNHLDVGKVRILWVREAELKRGTYICKLFSNEKVVSSKKLSLY